MIITCNNFPGSLGLFSADSQYSFIGEPEYSLFV